MLKLYRKAGPAGSTGEYWDESWDEFGDDLLVDNDRVCEASPLLPLLRSALRPDRVFLEGGCGPGQWVKYFHVRGYKTMGVDFAERTVARLRAHDPSFDVRVGDVTCFDLPSGSVHSYYSGGVVEHFEEGPEQALREARRVLADDGWFLCSVPDDSWLRRKVLFRNAKDTDAIDYVVRRVDATRADSTNEGRTFFQYEFTTDEFTTRLEAAGFEVVDTFGYSILFGLMEIPVLRRAWELAYARMRGNPSVLPASTGSATHAPSSTRPQVGLASQLRGAAMSTGRRFLFQEDRDMPVLGPMVRLLAEHAANMRMFVARPR